MKKLRVVDGFIKLSVATPNAPHHHDCKERYRHDQGRQFVILKERGHKIYEICSFVDADA